MHEEGKRLVAVSWELVSGKWSWEPACVFLPRVHTLGKITNVKIAGCKGNGDRPSATTAVRSPGHAQPQAQENTIFLGGHGHKSLHGLY